MRMNPKSSVLIARNKSDPTTGHIIRWTVESRRLQKGEARMPRNLMPWYKMR